MNKAAYIDFHRTCCERMHEITQAKNSDYTGDSESPFSNFDRVEAMGITDSLRGILVRMTDKMARLTSFVQTGALAVKDESVLDTALDLANYAIIYAAKVKALKDEQDTRYFNPEREYLHGKPEYERANDAIAR